MSKKADFNYRFWFYVLAATLLIQSLAYMIN